MKAILRTTKLKTFGNIAGSASHNFRERETENADPSRTPKNKHNGAQSAKEVQEAVKGRIATVPNLRTTSVLAVEYLITMSPEFHRNGGNVEGYLNEAEAWLKARHGADNVVSVSRHYDETTPHICAYVVPIDPAGRLNARHFLGGREKLAEMQTDFADKVGKKYGLQRGIEGSSAKHTDIKDFYSNLNKKTPRPSPLPPAPSGAGKLAGMLGLSSQSADFEEAKAKRKAEQKQRLRTVEAKAKQYDLEKKQNEARAKDLEQLRATATQARDLPLSLVLERLEATPDPKDRNNWKTPAGRLSVEGSKFFNHDTGKGGGGAIDLVIEQLSTDYRSAVSWLSKEFGSGAVLADQVAKAKAEIQEIKKTTKPADPMNAHQPQAEKWGQVRDYLTNSRGLSVSLVEDLKERGFLWADKWGNCVFPLSNVGLALRGTSPEPFHGVRGEKAPFVLLPTDSKSDKVAFVESPIDSLSLRELGFTGRIVATMGNSRNVVAVEAKKYREKGLVVVAAFDNDRAGEAMSQTLGQCERMTPHGKDWNEDLKAFKSQTETQPKAGATFRKGRP